MSVVDLKFENTDLPEFSKDQELIESATEGSEGSLSLLRNHDNKFKKTCRRMKRRLCSKQGIINLLFILLFTLSSYLYFVPLTNFVTLILFPDVSCDIWKTCYISFKGNVLPGFVTFVIIQLCLTTFIVGTYLLISSLWSGYPFRYDNRFIFRDFAWYDIESNKKYRCGKTTGSKLFATSFILYLICLISFMCVVGIFGGRLAAHEYFQECQQFRNTQLGFGGCLLDQKYVGNTFSCRKCAFIGMSITTLPVIVFILLSLCVFFGILKLRLLYKFRQRQRSLNIKYRTYHDIANSLSQTESQKFQIDGLSDLNTMNKKYGINYKSANDIKDNPYHVKREVCFICNEVAVEVTIGCGHATCFNCACKFPSCPSCHQRYRYSDIQDLI